MLHVTTEIGKPGRQERERRHYPDVHNQPGELPPYKPRGRRYIPHRFGKEEEWRPHNICLDEGLTESGPDWSSKLRYIPHPENPDYPAAEIWPNNWKSMRPYPFTYKRTTKEWEFDPGHKVGLRCYFDGVHRATAISDKEITHTELYGKGRNEVDIDKRNEMEEASPGDKSYQVPEYSPSFHGPRADSAIPRFSTGSSPYASVRRQRPDTFVPLVPVPQRKRESFRHRVEEKQRQEEIEDVKKLEVWQPAKHISSTIPQVDPSELKKY